MKKKTTTKVRVHVSRKIGSKAFSELYVWPFTLSLLSSLCMANRKMRRGRLRWPTVSSSLSQVAQYTKPHRKRAESREQRENSSSLLLMFPQNPKLCCGEGGASGAVARVFGSPFARIAILMQTNTLYTDAEGMKSPTRIDYRESQWHRFGQLAQFLWRSVQCSICPSHCSRVLMKR